MLIEVTNSVMERLIAELKEAEPQKREEFIQKVLDLVEILTKSLKS